MSKFFFSGSVATKLDEKNRFVLPQELRYGLVENGELEFYLALGLGGCLAIYKRSDIERIAQKFQAKQHVAKFQKFFTLFFSTLHHTSCDKIGRVHIPPMLKATAQLKSEIVIAGVLNKIEIWSKETYEANLKEALLEGRVGDFSEAFGLLEETPEDIMFEPATTKTLAEAAMNAMGKNKL